MFTNPVVGGLQLIRNAIQSINYVPGVSGWSINRDGTAEFATGTFRGPVLIVDPLTGDTLATINADGSASFQSVSASDFFIDGISVADTLANIGRGIVGQYRKTSNLVAPGLNGTYTDTCWTSFTYDVTRLYRITASTTQWKNDAGISTNQDLWARVNINQPGVTGGASNETVHFNKESATAGESTSLNIDFYIHGSSGRANGPMTVALQLAGSSNDGWTNFTTSYTEFQWTVEDVGPAITPNGGSGAPSGLLQWTVKYYAVASRSYDGNGTFIGAPDGNNNVYVSTFPDRPYVNERYQIVFPGSIIRTDLTGATIQSAKLWLYCFKAEESKGSLGFKVSTLSSVSSSFNGTGIDETWTDDDTWPNPGWYSFNLLSVSGGHTAISEFLATSNGNSIVSVQPLIPGLAATAFRGYGYSDSVRPYIEITYVGNPPTSATGYGLSGYGTGGYGS